MGAFYGSIHVRTENADAVRKAIDQVAKEASCNFLLGPALGGWISIFPSDSGQNDQISVEIAKHLPNDIFHLIVHDDDIFSYYFYRDGRSIDHYNSCPDYFEEVSDEEKQLCQGRPELFQDLLLKPKSLSRLKTLLAADKEKYTFESERMAQFVGLLGLSNALSSYEYLQEGERDEIEGWEQFNHIEGSGEKRPDAAETTGSAERPDPADAYNLLGQVKRTRGDLDGALADFNKAIELKPDMAATWNNRGLVKQTKGDQAGALADFSRAIVLKPDLAVAYNNRGEVKRARGDLDAALADYNQAIELKPDMAVAYNNRAEVKRARGDLNGSLADFSRAIELKPDSGKIYNNRGEAKRAKGDLDGALADYDKAIKLKPDLAAAYSNRGLLKQTKGDLDGALIDLNRAVELEPELAAAWNNRGIAKQVKGDLDGALDDFNRAMELKPGVTQFFKNRGEVKRVKGDLDGALADFNRAIELNSIWPDTYNSRGEAKRAKKDFDGAMVDFNRALELKPDFAAAFNNRGLVKQAKGDLEGALADCNRTIELNPSAAQAYNNRGRIKRAKGDLDGALADDNKALELKPDLAVARDNRDEVKRAKDKPAGAGVSNAGGNQKKIPTTENTLALRTDFSDEAAWKSLCATIQDPDAEFTANVDFISDPKYDGLIADKLPSLLSADSPLSFAFIIDRLALSHPDHPILVVDLQEKPGRTFRVIASALWEVENNLSIANMGFDEFASAVDKNGIYRGSQE